MTSESCQLSVTGHSASCCRLQRSSVCLHTSKVIPQGSAFSRDEEPRGFPNCVSGWIVMWLERKFVPKHLANDRFIHGDQNPWGEKSCVICNGGQWTWKWEFWPNILKIKTFLNEYFFSGSEPICLIASYAHWDTKLDFYYIQCKIVSGFIRKSSVAQISVDYISLNSWH